jgi:cytochrome c-type biogenesis protein CcmE
MKITHIIGIIAIALAVGIIVSSAGNASQYVDFKQAKIIAEGGNADKVHVVGELTKDPTGKVIGVEYNPLKDPNYLAFSVIDEKKTVQKVVCYNPPPSMQDFTKSEKVVIIGKYKDNVFVASEILMKCPSKYEEKELKQ